MTSPWRILLAMFGRKATHAAPRDPAIVKATTDSYDKIDRTHQLLDELRSRTEAARLNRARLVYEEGLNSGNRGA